MTGPVEPIVLVWVIVTWAVGLYPGQNLSMNLTASDYEALAFNLRERMVILTICAFAAISTEASAVLFMKLIAATNHNGITETTGDDRSHTVDLQVWLNWPSNGRFFICLQHIQKNEMDRDLRRERLAPR